MKEGFINETFNDAKKGKTESFMSLEEQVALVKRYRETRDICDEEKIYKLVKPCIKSFAGRVYRKYYTKIRQSNINDYDDILAMCWEFHFCDIFPKYDTERGTKYTTYLFTELGHKFYDYFQKKEVLTVPLEGFIFDDGDMTLEDTITNSHSVDPEKNMINQDEHKQIVSGFSDIEKRVLELLNDGYNKKEIVEEMRLEGYDIDKTKYHIIKKVGFKVYYNKDVVAKNHERSKIATQNLKSHPIHFWTEDYSKMVEDVDWTCRDNSVVGIIEELKRIDSHTISEYLEKYIEDNFVPRMSEELLLELDYFIKADKKNKRAEKRLIDNYLEYACKKYYNSEFYRKTVGPGLVYGITRCTLFKVVCGIIDLQNDSFFNGTELLSVLLEKACGERDVYFKDPYEVMVYYCLYNKYSNGYSRTYDKVIELTQMYEDSFKSLEYKDIIEPEFIPNTATVKYNNWWKDEISKGMSEEELIKHLVIKTKHFKWVQDLVEKNQMRENGLKKIDESELLEEKIRVSKKNFHEWEVASPKSKTMTVVYNELVQKSREEWDYILTKNKVSNNDLMAILKMYGDAEVGKEIEDLDVIVSKHSKWFDKGCRISKNDFVKASGNVQNNLTRNHIITMVFLLYCAYIKNDKACQEMSPEEWYIDYCDMVNNELVKCDLMPFYRPHIYEAFITVCILSGAPLYNYTKAMDLLKNGIEK